MPELLDAYVYDGARSAFGRHGGVLASLRPDDLLAHVLSTLTRRNPFPGAAYEDVIIGNTNQAGEDCRNVGRYAVLLAGLPGNVGGLTVNRLCGSGLAAVLDAAHAVRCREGGLFVAGGVESMSRAPLILSKATTPCRRRRTTSRASWASAVWTATPTPPCRRLVTRPPVSRASSPARFLPPKCRRGASSRRGW
jgi:acetyl-CoA acetyltransferase